MLVNGIDVQTQNKLMNCYQVCSQMNYEYQKDMPKSQISKFLKVSEVTISRC